MTYDKNYYEKNKEKFLEWQREYRKKNHDKVLENRRRYDKENRERQLELKYQWRKNNLSKHKLQKKKSDAKHYAKIKNDPEFKQKKSAYQSKHYRENRDRILEYGRKHMEVPEVKERKLMVNRIWNKNNPEKRLQIQVTRLSKFGKAFDLKPNEYQYALIMWTQAVRKKHNNVCQICFKPAEHSHHILHKAKYPELSLNVNNGIPLCKIHHQESHGQLLVQRGRD